MCFTMDINPEVVFEMLFVIHQGVCIGGQVLTFVLLAK